MAALLPARPDCEERENAVYVRDKQNDEAKKEKGEMCELGRVWFQGW